MTDVALTAKLRIAIAQRTAALAANLFKTDPVLVAGRADLLSAFDHVVSIYRDTQLQNYSSGGSFSPADRKKADFAAKNLQMMLENMFDDIEKIPLTTSGDVLGKWGGQLMLVGSPVYLFIVKALTDDFRKAQREVARELKNPTSELGRVAASLRTASFPDVCKTPGTPSPVPIPYPTHSPPPPRPR